MTRGNQVRFSVVAQYGHTHLDGYWWRVEHEEEVKETLCADWLVWNSVNAIAQRRKRLLRDRYGLLDARSHSQCPALRIARKANASVYTRSLLSSTTEFTFEFWQCEGEAQEMGLAGSN